MLGHGGVVFIGDLIEGETILETGATAALHEHAQFQIRIAFFGNQVSDFGGRAVGEDNRLRHGRRYRLG